MKASEAKSIATNHVLSEFWKHYDKVIDEIKRFASVGKTEVFWYNVLPKNVEAHLIELGYKVTRISDGRNGEDVKISWD